MTNTMHPEIVQTIPNLCVAIIFFLQVSILPAVLVK